MIFVVAVEPDCIPSCLALGDLGEDQIVGVFEALLQNCLLAETTGSWRLSAALTDTVKAVTSVSIRKRLTAILETLLSPTTNCRFVEAIQGYEVDYESTILEILASQGNNSELDAIITSELIQCTTVDSVKITEFNRSNFARERSRLASSSIVYAPKDIQAADLLNEVFHRVIKYSDKIEIYDRQMGISMGGNYHEAIEHWCQFFASFDRKLSLHVHTTSNQAAATKRKFAEHLSNTKVQLSVYAHDEEAQPHDRFLRSCGFTFDIGRGVDLFDRSGFCRDVKIGLSDHGGFTQQWRNLANSQAI
jgi:hypothetical protein